MKKRVLFSLLLFALIVVPSFASVTVEQSTDPEYMMNQGFSQITAEDVFMLKNRARGNTIEPLYNKDQNGFVKGWKAFWGYVDPANVSYDRLHHDIKPSPSPSDL